MPDAARSGRPSCPPEPSEGRSFGKVCWHANHADPGGPDGKTSPGYLWGLSRPGCDVVFEWRLTRKHEEAGKLLGDFTGVLQSDGYEAYPAYARTHPGVVWVGCWAHARRKFFEALATAPSAANFILRLIGQLYHYEQVWTAAGVHDPVARANLRGAHFGLTLQLLARSLEKLRTRSLPQSPLGQACDYLLNHWAPLTAHLEHGQTQIDTNAIENARLPARDDHQGRSAPTPAQPVENPAATVVATMVEPTPAAAR